MARTSTPWALLPAKELGCGSATTCWRRLDEWLLGVVEADIVGQHAPLQQLLLGRWASWPSGKSTARYPAAVRYQGRRVPRAGCSNGQSCDAVIAPSGGTGGAAHGHDKHAVCVKPSTLAMHATDGPRTQ
jgi:hypothetical protein